MKYSRPWACQKEEIISSNTLMSTCLPMWSVPPPPSLAHSSHCRSDKPYRKEGEWGQNTGPGHMFWRLSYYDLRVYSSNGCKGQPTEGQRTAKSTRPYGSQTETWIPNRNAGLGRLGIVNDSIATNVVLAGAGRGLGSRGISALLLLRLFRL